MCFTAVIVSDFACAATDDGLERNRACGDEIDAS
jgi:hypothetical protein